jgi:Fe-S-cluster containining protein
MVFPTAFRCRGGDSFCLPAPIEYHVPGVLSVAVPFITSGIAALRRELEALSAYPLEELAAIIAEVGFSCTCCGLCCTRQFNGHVFLLGDEAERIRRARPDALLPAPFFELCDQHGRFYVSGHALRTQDDGSCIFLEHGRCTIYAERPSICRVYPYMLHREPDENGAIDWRQISGLNLHGTYHAGIGPEEAMRIAAETKSYESAFLEHEIAFFECADRYFAGHGLRHVKRTYDMEMRRFRNGEEIEVRVFTGTGFEPVRVSIRDYPMP